MLIESVEAFAPEMAIEIEPFGGCLQALRIEPAAAELAVAFLADQGGASSTRKCREIAGSEMAKGRANSVTVASPDARR